MAAAVCPFATLEGAVGCVVDVGRLGIPVARIELADAAQIDAINRYDDMDHEVAPTLFLEFHGSPDRGRGAGRRGPGDRAEHGASRFRGRPTRPTAAGSGTRATAPTTPPARRGPAARA